MQGDDSRSPTHAFVAWYCLLLCILLHKSALPKYGIPELEIIICYQCSLKTGSVLRPKSSYVLSRAPKCNSHSSHAPNILFYFIITQRKNQFFSVLATHVTDTRGKEIREIKPILLHIWQGDSPTAYS